MVGRQRRAPAAPNAKHLLRRGAAKLGRLGRDNGGSVVVLAGFLFPVVIGGMGLGAETGYWYWTQRKVQHAADVSAHAAGIRKLQGENDSAELKEIAQHVAQKADFNPGEVVLNTPYDGSNDKVEVILTETLPRLFTALFTGEDLTLTGRAVVEISEGQHACVLALEEDLTGIEVGGTASLTMNGCDIASNSVSSEALKMHGNAGLSTRCVHTVGQAVTNGKENLTECSGPNGDEVHEFARKTLDPYANLAEPEEKGDCESRNFPPSQIHDLDPQPQGHSSGLPIYRFCGSVDFKGKINFGPGLYIFSCPISGNCSNVTVSAGGSATGGEKTELNGEDVIFYFSPGIKVNFNGNATINLKARTVDPYAGILFFSGRNGARASHTVNGGAGGTFQGVVYFPGGDVTYAGGATAGGGGCTQIIGRTVTFTGNSDVAADCEKAGTRDILANRGVKIIE